MSTSDPLLAVAFILVVTSAMEHYYERDIISVINIKYLW